MIINPKINIFKSYHTMDASTPLKIGITCEKLALASILWVCKNIALILICWFFLKKRVNYTNYLQGFVK